MLRRFGIERPDEAAAAAARLHREGDEMKPRGGEWTWGQKDKQQVKEHSLFSVTLSLAWAQKRSSIPWHRAFRRRGCRSFRGACCARRARAKLAEAAAPKRLQPSVQVVNRSAFACSESGELSCQVGRRPPKQTMYRWSAQQQQIIQRAEAREEHVDAKPILVLSERAETWS